MLELVYRDLRHFESTELGGGINWLIDRLCCKRLPAIDLAHVDLTGGEQRPEQHRRRIADGSTVCVLIRRLNSSCKRSTAFVVFALRHWLGGKRVKVPAFMPKVP